MTDTDQEPVDVAEKRYFYICDAKKVCHVCGDQTLLCCSDCAINFSAAVRVCKKTDCRNEHERKCWGCKP